MALRISLAVFASAILGTAAGPVLQFSTYLGGAHGGGVPRVALAPDGNLYVALATSSTDLPVLSDVSQPPLHTGPLHVYVAKVSPAGKILRSSYIGNAVSDAVSGLVVDARGDVWVGSDFIARLSPDRLFPAQSSVAPLGSAGAFAVDATGAVWLAGSAGLLAKLTTNGDVAYTAQLGGGYVRLSAIVVDPFGRTVVAGYTEAPEISGGGARYGSRSGTGDAFVARLAPDGRSLAWLRYIDFGGYEMATALAFDAAGNLWIAGTTTSASARGFVTRISADGATVLSSQLLGVQPAALAADPKGGVWLSGSCCFGPFESAPDALQPTRNGPLADAFLSWIPDEGPPSWTTLIGGTGVDSGSTVAVRDGVVVLAGYTQSFDFPLNHAIQRNLHSKPDASPVVADAFLARFGAAQTGPPALQSIANAASYRTGEAAPNTIVSIFGDDLSSQIRPGAGEGTVTVNGAPAVVFYTSPSQLNVLIPPETRPGTAVVQVRRDDGAASETSLAIVPYSPGIFADYRGWAAINSRSNDSYINPGDWLTFYCTGLGGLDAPLTVTLGGVPLEVTWFGLAPGFLGLYQVNVQLPANLDAGYRLDPLVLRIGGRESNAPLVGVAGAPPR